MRGSPLRLRALRTTAPCASTGVYKKLDGSMVLDFVLGVVSGYGQGFTFWERLRAAGAERSRPVWNMMRATSVGGCISRP
eukprot:8926226-Alexandrium_andersonii.AAC.1